jgi:hypothetical protein
MPCEFASRTSHVGTLVRSLSECIEGWVQWQRRVSLQLGQHQRACHEAQEHRVRTT